MSEFEAAIREHLELKRRGEERLGVPSIVRGLEVGMRMPATCDVPSLNERPADKSRVGSTAASNGFVDRTSVARPGGDRPALPRASNRAATALVFEPPEAQPTVVGDTIPSVEEESGLIAPGELVARRSAARARSHRINASGELWAWWDSWGFWR